MISAQESCCVTLCVPTRSQSLSVWKWSGNLLRYALESLEMNQDGGWGWAKRVDNWGACICCNVAMSRWFSVHTEVGNRVALSAVAAHAQRETCSVPWCTAFLGQKPIISCPREAAAPPHGDQSGFPSRCSGGDGISTNVHVPSRRKLVIIIKPRYWFWYLGQQTHAIQSLHLQYSKRKWKKMHFLLMCHASGAGVK